MAGISVIICCYNSAERITGVLKHLAGQQDTAGIPWEILVVDNASTDHTAETVKKQWQGNAIPLEIVFEPQPGLSHARITGINHARYPVVSFIDDDNWVCENWIKTTHNIMTRHPEVALCGGRGEPVFGEDPPDWFYAYQSAFAVGPQGYEAGYVSSDRNYLYGAGCSMRKSVWELLIRNGFTYQLSGRKGKALSSGEDQELCLAVILAGYRLWYEPALAFRHYMPSGRLKISYLSDLFKAFGRADTIMNIYKSELPDITPRKKYIYQHLWLVIPYALMFLVKDSVRCIMRWRKGPARTRAILYFSRTVSWFATLLLYAPRYKHMVDLIRNAGWRNAESQY